MQVVFKLTAAQALIATALVAKPNPFPVNGEDDEPHYTVDCGNVLGHVWAHPCFNEDQNLEFNPDARTLTYTGQRHPLVVDGALAAIKEIAGGDLSALRMVKYETSDKRLRWYETLESYISDRGTADERYEYSLKKLKVWGDANVVEVLQGYGVERHVVDAVKAIVAGKSGNWLSASFPVGVVRLAQKAVRANELIS